MPNGQNVPVKNLEELKLMRKSGKITALALKKVIENTKVGVSLLDLDKMAEEEIKRLGGESSFKTIPHYSFTTCLTLNEEVVHGLPRDIQLKEGDILGIDLGAVYQGWHTDAAWSVLVREQGTGDSKQEDKREFLKVGERVLWEAVRQAVAGKRVGDISTVIEEGVKSAGFAVVKNFAGHGVGKQPHEAPEIPTYGKKGTGLILEEGMTLAIEVIYAKRKGEVYEKGDGWTVATHDGSLGGLFEMSVVVGKKSSEVLTNWRKVL